MKYVLKAVMAHLEFIMQNLTTQFTILHAFNKKTQKTNMQDITLAKQRYKLVLQLIK